MAESPLPEGRGAGVRARFPPPLQCRHETRRRCDPAPAAARGRAGRQPGERAATAPQGRGGGGPGRRSGDGREPGPPRRRPQRRPRVRPQPLHARAGGLARVPAPIDTGTGKPLAVHGRTLLQLAPRARHAIVVPLESLYWDHYQSVIWPSRPLRRVVLPGRYDLTLEIRDPETGSTWRSDPIPAVVKKAGSLELVKPN